MIGLLGKKVGMTQTFDEQGQQRAVTLLEVGPCYVTYLADSKKEGYAAVQLAYDPAKEKRVNKARKGLFKKSKVPVSRFVREIRTHDVTGLTVGQELLVDNFEAGDFVDIQGISIGKGFQGVVKRHHFKGGEASHGAKFGRESGSIAQGSAFPSRVPKGRRMAGQMGNEKVTVQNLRVVSVDPENHLMAVRGAVPGYEGGYLVIKMALKRGKGRGWKVVSQETDSEKPSQEAPDKESAEKAGSIKSQDSKD